MNRDQFWLMEAQYFPTDMRGKARVNDRRVISGIIHVLKSGGCWINAPPKHGPTKTFYNYYVRWATRSIWVDLSRRSRRQMGRSCRFSSALPR